MAVASQLSLNVCSGAVESAQASFVKTWQQASFVKTWHQLTYPLESEKTMNIRGRNLITGLPAAMEISSIEIREALNNSLQVIIDTIKDALDEVPPEIGADLLDTGICMAGGGSLLQGIVLRLSDELKIRVFLAEDPMTCVARGAGIVLEDLNRFSHLLVDVDRSKQRQA